MTPQTVNAYYNPTFNEIVFPAAILQPPFFDPNADPAVNYGAIGGVIGHEMGHGFDDQGAKSDAKGVLRTWWQPADEKAFKKLGRQPGRAVRRLRGAARAQGQRPADARREHRRPRRPDASRYEAYHLSLDGKHAPVHRRPHRRPALLPVWAQAWRTLLSRAAPAQPGDERSAQPGAVPRERRRAQHGRVVRRVRRASRAMRCTWSRRSASGSGERCCARNVSQAATSPSGRAGTRSCAVPRCRE